MRFESEVKKITGKNGRGKNVRFCQISNYMSLISMKLIVRIYGRRIDGCCIADQ